MDREKVSPRIGGGITVFKADSDVLASFQGERGVLLDYSREFYFGINAVGACIWKLLEVGATIDSIVATVLQQFEVEEHVARQDAVEFLSELQRRGMVRTQEAEA